MKIFKFVLMLIILVIASPVISGGDEFQRDAHVEDLLEQIETRIESAEKEIEEELILAKTPRRISSSSNSNQVLKPENSTRFSTSYFPDFLGKMVYNFDIYLCQNEEISFLHRFQLY